jgi:hypothetical protein
MQPFRPTRGGGARAWLAASEASLLRSLVGQVMTLIAPDGPGPAPDQVPGQAPGQVPGEQQKQENLEGEIAALEALLHEPATPDQAPKVPDDPVLARLLPDAYRDDPDAAGEFRKYTESGLRSAKRQAAQDMLDTLPEDGGRIRLTPDQAVAWLKALNDVRLALGVRLGVTEDFEKQWARLAQDDPRWTAYEVYAWLGAVQESLVQALGR